MPNSPDFQETTRFCICYRLRALHHAPLELSDTMNRDEAAKQVAIMVLRGYAAYVIYAF